MSPFLRSNSAILGAAIALAAMAAAGFAPLFGGPGYESALAAGLVLPPAVAIATALELARERTEPFDAFCRGVANGAAFAGLAFATTLLHGLRAGFCDPLGGAALFALGPGVGALFAGVWGALAAEVARLRRPGGLRVAIAVVFALAAPFASIALSISRFYTSPMIYAFDPFVGYFSGTLYDTVIDYSGLLTYRAGSAVTMLAAFVAALHLGHDDEGRLAFQAIGRPGLLVAGCLAAAASVVNMVEGARLHHWATSATIAQALGASISGTRCDVVYARTLREEDARRLLGECEAQVEAGERWFGVSGTPKITAFVFADAAQKARLMGAADTNIAKPWRREVYIQGLSYPHSVLGHEVAHVIAGGFGRGPFKIAGSLFGILPNPGLIEGAAVAASPSAGELTPREWAKAMKDVSLLPPLSRLYGLGFLGENQSLAYTVSGAFCGFVHDRYGPGALRAWYGGTDLGAATGVAWADVEAEWHKDLDRVVLPELAKAHAKARFDRPAVFGRRCPHVVDGCKQKAERLHSQGDETGAIAEFERARALDPTDFAASFGVARALYRQGDLEGARARLEALIADPAVRVTNKDQAREELADIALATGDDAKAVALYRDVESRMLDEDKLRTIEVKIAVAKDPAARQAVVALLVGLPGRAPDRVLAAELLGAWSTSAPTDGLPLYLLGRQLTTSGQYPEAKDRLDRALSARIAIARVQVEAERLRMITACALSDVPTAEKWYIAYAGHPTVGASRRAAARAFLERCGGRPSDGGAK